MIDDTKTAKQRPSNFSDDAIRSFLLGELTADDQTQFEQRVFTDDDFESRLRLAEFALADEYARDQLTQTQKTQFRQKYLVSAERKRILSVSETLRARFASSDVVHANFAHSLRAFFDISRPVWRYAFATLILLFVFATVWRGIKEPRFVEHIIPKRVAPKPTATPQQANHPTTTSLPNHVEEYSPLPLHTTIVVSVSLNAQNTADNPTVVNPPKTENGLVRFGLQMARGEGASYQAELLTMKGESIFKVDSLAPTKDSKINFDVPARALKPADYEIRLTRINNGSLESLIYYLRVK